jgi:hypothetical protein
MRTKTSLHGKFPAPGKTTILSEEHGIPELVQPMGAATGVLVDQSREKSSNPRIVIPRCENGQSLKHGQHRLPDRGCHLKSGDSMDNEQSSHSKKLWTGGKFLPERGKSIGPLKAALHPLLASMDKSPTRNTKLVILGYHLKDGILVF